MNFLDRSALDKAQSIIDAWNDKADRDGRKRDALVSSLAGILVCDLREETSAAHPLPGDFDLPTCLRHYADMLERARG